MKSSPLESQKHFYDKLAECSENEESEIDGKRRNTKGGQIESEKFFQTIALWRFQREKKTRHKTNFLASSAENVLKLLIPPFARET